MTFKHKLSRRLALLRGPAVAAAILATACSDHSVNAPEPGEDRPAALAALSTVPVMGSRLQTIYVTNVRTASGALVGTQPKGALGSVSGGPTVDAGGVTRWQINFDAGADGWVSADYLTEAPAVSNRFAMGARVQTPGANIRSTPAASGTLVGAQPAGAQGTVTGGPVLDATGDHLIRWLVNFDQGADGWAAEDYLAAAPAGPVVASVVVTPAAAAVIVAQSVQLTAVAKDAAGTILQNTAMAWISGDTMVARVTAAGLVTGMAVGSTYAIASSGGRSDTTAVTVTQAVRAGYYVSPTAVAGGDGSIGRPWTMNTALSGGGGRVQPGDTVWLRGGTYRGAFRSTLQGAPGQPVVVRQYPGERAIVDGAGTPGNISVWYVGGEWSVFWGFEIINSDPVRTSTSTGSHERANVVSNYANHTRYVNLVVNDGGVAFYNEPQYADVEIAGCIVFNNGWQGPDRGHGHALYLKSNSGPVVARDNVLFNQFGYGVHLYANAGSGQLNNIRLEGNVAFNNGSLATNSTSSNILVGGDDRATGDVLRDNMTWYSQGVAGTNVKVGYGSLMNGTVQLQGNYFAGGGPVLELGYWTSATITGNTFIGGAALITLNDPSNAGKTWSANTHQRDPLATAWRYRGTNYPYLLWNTLTGHLLSDLSLPGLPTPVKVVVRANPYEAGRGMVVVYNWSRLGSVTANLSGVLSPGDRYEVRNVQSLNGAPVVSGTYAGGSISLPMNGVTPPTPIGFASSRAPRTGPDFDVFIVTRL